jgi:hypothetical protein
LSACFGVAGVVSGDVVLLLLLFGVADAAPVLLLLLLLLSVFTRVLARGEIGNDS